MSPQHDHEDSSDDHFSSASEGDNGIPTTRVERVDGEAAHGEVPGTSAYEKRTQDAVPDEVEIVPDSEPTRAGSTSRSRAASQLKSPPSRSETPGGSPVPKTVVERVDLEPAHGEVDGTAAKEMRLADAVPDEVRVAPKGGAGAKLEGRGLRRGTRGDEDRQAWFRSMWESSPEEPKSQGALRAEERGEDDVGDDFDDFAEEGDDFGDFDEAEEQTTPASPCEPQQPPSDTLSNLPPLNLLSCASPLEVKQALQPFLAATLTEPTSAAAPSSPPPPPPPPLDASQTSPFLSDRSLSLWQQLVSPPPMQPPNWTRSRIRRLFLVSLGVPVDLDEILPPGKQKRLVLHSIGLDADSGRGGGTAPGRLHTHDTAAASTTSLDSRANKKAAKPKPKPKGPPPPPPFDFNGAQLLCLTTMEALSGLSEAELRAHLAQLERMNGEASRLLEYWLQRKDEDLKEKEALEGVIENLVGFVKGRRGK